jgi:hypothetical protein
MLHLYTSNSSLVQQYVVSKNCIVIAYFVLIFMHLSRIAVSANQLILFHYYVGLPCSPAASPSPSPSPVPCATNKEGGLCVCPGWVLNIEGEFCVQNCAPNSSPIGGKCTCNSGFIRYSAICVSCGVPNPGGDCPCPEWYVNLDGNTCVQQCPQSSTGNGVSGNCECNTGYVYDNVEDACLCTDINYGISNSQCVVCSTVNVGLEPEANAGADSTCVCTAAGYGVLNGNCVQCSSSGNGFITDTNEGSANACVCDAANNWVTDTATTCKCASGYFPNEAGTACELPAPGGAYGTSDSLRSIFRSHS